MPETVAPENQNFKQTADDMILHEPISFASVDGTSTCVGDLWSPPGEARGVVHIVHGMVEHLGRYEDFALELCRAGYAVCGIDLIGHGRSCPDHDQRGIYQPESGADALVEDQHELRHLVQPRFAGKPYFILGHSMGSFITRCYISRHGGGLAGAVVLGTGWQAYALLGVGEGLTKAIGKARGWDFRSKLINAISVGGYNKAFEGTGIQSGYEWLSRDEERVQAFVQDQDCGWIFSVSAFYALFQLIDESQDYKRIEMVPPSLPILIMSGGKDPVGEDGVGPARCYRAFKEVGIQDVDLVIKENDRHELLGELDKEEVVTELLAWIEAHTA